MKKLAVGVIGAGALAVAGALGTSYYMGEHIQQTMTQMTEAWASDGGLTVRLLDYDRGLLTSHATTLWSIASEEENYDITVVHNIVHGPWPMGKAAKVVSRFLLPPDSEAALLQALQQRAPLEWTTTASWSGTTAHHVTSPNFQTAFEDGSALTWGGLKAEWTLSAQRDAVQGFVRMPVLRVEVQDGSRMDMEDAELTFDAQMPQGYSFWTGPTALKLGMLSVLDTEEATQLKLQHLQLESSNVMQNALLQSGIQAQLQNVDSANFHAQNLKLQVQMKNIEANWFEQWMQWLQTGTESEEQTMSLLQNLPALLAGKPELHIQRLSMDSGDGPVSLAAHVRYSGTDPEQFNPITDLEGQLQTAMPLPVLKQLLGSRVRSDYLELLEQMDREIDEAELQAAVNDGVGKRLKALLSQAVVQKQGDAVSASLSFSNGEFKLNNQPQTLQQLLGIGGAL